MTKSDARGNAQPHGRRWCPEEESSFLSRLWFGWASSLIHTGSKKPLRASDLWSLCRQDEAQEVAQKLGVAWGPSVQRDASLTTALLKANGSEFVLAGVIKLAHDVFQFSSPIFIREIIEFLKDPESSLWWGALLCVGLLASNLLQSIFIHSYFQRVYRTGLHVRTSVISVIYLKALNLNLSAKQTTSTGEINRSKVKSQESLCCLCPESFAGTASLLSFWARDAIVA